MKSPAVPTDDIRHDVNACSSDNPCPLGQFCNFDSTRIEITDQGTSFCEHCDKVGYIAETDTVDCDNDGLPDKGAATCNTKCNNQI